MQNDPMQELEQAIERLYSVFARYPLKPRIYGCAHCISAEDNARIHSKPLRQLDWHDLQRFAHKSMSTWGDANDFKHFLPRLLELLPQSNMWPISIDRLCPKIHAADFLDWPAAERLAIDDYFLALWQAVVLTDAVPMDVHEFLKAVVDGHMTVQPFLEAWERLLEQGGAALHKLPYFVDRVAWDYLRPGEAHNLPSEWSLDTAEQHGWPAILRWLINPELKSELEDLYFQQQDADFARELSQVIEHLDVLRTARLSHT